MRLNLPRYHCILFRVASEFNVPKRRDGEIQAFMKRTETIPIPAEGGEEETLVVHFGSRSIVGGITHKVMGHLVRRIREDDLSISPNPPMDTDGRREDTGRRPRSYKSDGPGSNSGRWEVGGGSLVVAQGPNGRLGELRCADGQGISSRELPRGWLVRVGGDVGSVAEGAVRLGVEWLAAGPGRD